MAFNGNEGEIVTLAEAVDWTTRYRNSVPVGSTLGHFVGKNKIGSILSQEDCMGIRIYFGEEESGVKNLVLVGVDAAEDDLYEGVIVERTIRCPPMCGSGKSPLK